MGMAGSQDQSMEEILQSIKRIIAEEADDDAPEQSINSLAKDSSVKGSDMFDITDVEDEEPLELEDIVDEGFEPVAAEQDTSEEDVFSAVMEEMAAVDEFDAMQAEEAAKEEAPPALEMDETSFLSFADDEDESSDDQHDILDNIDSLLSDEVAKTTASAFHKIVEAKHRPSDHHSTIDGGLNFRSGTTVEDLTMELLKPLMKQWLETNLPPIVERLVAQEIKRLAEAS